MFFSETLHPSFPVKSSDRFWKDAELHKAKTSSYESSLLDASFILCEVHLEKTAALKIVRVLVSDIRPSSCLFSRKENVVEVNGQP